MTTHHGGYGSRTEPTGPLPVQTPVDYSATLSFTVDAEDRAEFAEGLKALFKGVPMCSCHPYGAPESVEELKESCAVHGEFVRRAQWLEKLHEMNNDDNTETRAYQAHLRLGFEKGYI